jgi:hypothetical protein
MEMRKNVQGRLSTDTKDLRTLCDEVLKEEVKVPQFSAKVRLEGATGYRSSGQYSQQLPSWESVALEDEA